MLGADVVKLGAPLCGSGRGLARGPVRQPADPDPLPKNDQRGFHLGGTTCLSLLVQYGLVCFMCCLSCQGSP